MPLSSALVAFLIVVTLALATPPAHASEAVEYYHQGLDHYFITSDANEKRALDAGLHRGWVRTGQTFQVFNTGDARLAKSVPVCRFYGNPARGLDSHFYSATPQECVEVKARFPNEWLIESDEVFRVHGVSPTTGLCPANTTPVYRLYNGRADVNHRYTTDLSVVDAMLAKGYTLEGIGSIRPIVFCAADIAPPVPASGAPACTLAVSTEFPILGVPLEMTATCNGSPTTYAWINCTASGPTCTDTLNAAGPVVYGVVATNARGAGAPGRPAAEGRAHRYGHLRQDQDRYPHRPRHGGGGCLGQYRSRRGAAGGRGEDAGADRDRVGPCAAPGRRDARRQPPFGTPDLSANR